jgi:micrococcal nuclease
MSRWKKVVAAGMVSVLLLAVASGVSWYRNPDQSLADALESGHALLEGKDTPSAGGAAATDRSVATVRRVVDGDTLVVAIGGVEERVRLLNIDTPESVHPDAARNLAIGKKASGFTRERLENRQVRLESGREERDRFGRRLAYVFTEGSNFNVELVREGWSPYYTKYGRSEAYDADFRRAEEEARSTKKGIWGDVDYLAAMSAADDE